MIHMIAGRQAELLLDASPDAYLVVSRDGEIVGASASVFTVFGWPPGDLIGNSVRMLVADAQIDNHDVGFADYWLRPPVHRDLFDRGPLIGKRRDGGDALVQIALVPLGPDFPDLVGCICRDVRSRQQATAHASGVMLSGLKDLKEAQSAR